MSLWPKPEHWWVDLVFDFARLEIPTSLSSAESEQLREKLFGADFVWPSGDEQLVLLDVEHIKWKPTEPAAAQSKLHGLLKAVESRGATSKVRQTVAEMLGRVEMRGYVWLNASTSALEPHYTLTLRTIEEWVGFVLAALIDSGLDIKDRLRRCAHCGGYFIAWDNRAKFCSASHGSQARVKAKRIRDAERMRRAGL